MSVLTEIDERVPRNVCLVLGHRLNHDACPANECVELAAAVVPGLSLYNDRRFANVVADMRHESASVIALA